MSILGDLTGLGTIAETIGGVLTKIIPDPNQRVQAELEINKALLANSSQIYQSMSTVMAADAASESWMTRNARPSVVFWCLGTISWVIGTAFIDSIAGTQMLAPTIKALTAVPDQLWNMVMVGIGGYILAKGVTDGIKNYKGK